MEGKEEGQDGGLVTTVFYEVTPEPYNPVKGPVLVEGEKRREEPVGAALNPLNS